MTKLNARVLTLILGLSILALAPLGTGTSTPGQFVRKSGDEMSGNLDLGANALVLDGTALHAAGGALEFGPDTVCLASTGCGATASPMAFFDEAYTYVNFSGPVACTGHTDAVLNVTAPGPGLILVTGAVSLELEHAQGTADLGRLRAHAVGYGCLAPGAYDVWFSVPASMPNGFYQQTHAVTAALPVAGAGLYAFSVFGAVEDGFSPGDRYLTANLQAVWYPG